MSDEQPPTGTEAEQPQASTETEQPQTSTDEAAKAVVIPSTESGSPGFTVMTESRALSIISAMIHRALLPGRMSRDAKRRSIVRELIETERNYVDSLLICEEVYYKPLDKSISSKSPLIDTATLSQLFGNLDQIRETHQIILRAMDEVVPLLKYAFPPHEVFLRIGTAFTEVIPRMQQLYTLYLSSSEGTEERMKKLKKNKKFRTFLSECLFNPRSKCQEIEDLLILPTQRIAGYKLLFERVLRYFPVETHGKERAVFQGVLDNLMQLGAVMNAEKGDSSSQEKLLNIAETVQKIPSFMAILKPGRKYKGSVTLKSIEETGKTGKQHVMYVTSDILIIARKHDRNKIYFVDAVPITQVRFGAFENQAFDKFSDKGFAMKTDTQNYNFIMKSTEIRDKFIDEIKRMRKGIRDQVEKQTQEGSEYMQSLINKLTLLYTEPTPPKTREEAIASLS